MMRALLLLFTCAALPGMAQQTAQYTQYVNNMFAINPAVAGSKECLDVRLGYRQQWVGFSGAPSTAWATVQGSIRPKKNAYRTGHHGIGVFMEADNSGLLATTTLQLAYAYHIQMNKDFHMALGTFAGVKQERFALGDVVVADNDDPALTANGSVLVYPEFTPGVWFYGNSTWGGFSIQQVLGNKVPEIGLDSKLTRHFIASFGHRYRASPHFSVMPSALVKLSAGAPMALDINVMVEYDRKVGLGVTYRNQDAVAFLVKVPLMKYFSLGYSYDLTTSNLRIGGSNTHEIILSIYPCTALDPAKEIVRCPIFE